jgi:tyrosinase
MTDELIIRKSVTSLNNNEKQKFIEAVKALKSNTKDAKIGSNRYDDYVLIHAKAMSKAAGTDADYNMRNLAHRGPIFLPWHREFLRRFELDLRNEVDDIAVPYWDWAEDAVREASAAFPPNTWPIWSDDFLGGDGVPDEDPLKRFVKSGPFADWITVEADQHTGNPIGKGRLRRSFQQDAPRLPTRSDIFNSFKFDFYDTPYWEIRSRGFRNALEGPLHNLIHRWVGGSMLLNTSPNDPVFFLHHCNVDRIWALWQAIRSGNEGNSGIDYPFDMVDRDRKRLRNYNLDDKIFPWEEVADKTVKDVLRYQDLGYIYDK